MNKKRIAINGFGRIGRGVFKNIVKNYPHHLEVVAINDLTPAKDIPHLLKYDSVYRKFSEEVYCQDNLLKVNNQDIKLFSEKDPISLPWGDLGIDLVIECTGIFNDYQKAEKHLTAGAKKVLISAPSKEPERIPSFVMGVNEEKYHQQDSPIVDMGSCTTNCLAPLAKIINDHYTIVNGCMTTIHSYTISQNLLDGAHKDLRRARAAALNIIPTSTGATKAIGRVLPELEGKITGIAMRVPTPTVSNIDLVCALKETPSREEVCQLLREEVKKDNLKNIIRIETEKLVSSDFIGSPYSSIVDEELISVTGNLLKIVSWYDNEWGYSTRLSDFTNYITQS